MRVEVKTTSHALKQFACTLTPPPLRINLYFDAVKEQVWAEPDTWLARTTPDSPYLFGRVVRLIWNPENCKIQERASTDED